ncbi:MAG: Ppx/GppA family phosphatase [Nitrospinae bacterium]|nr:Ppx/GppA family phosphatase [Nitrospinota bacterium]
MHQKYGRHAVLDIGSNTIRLLVADAAAGGGFKELHSAQLITRLAQKAHESGGLLDEAMERTIAGVGKLIEGAAHLKPFCVTASGTHAVRKAQNGKRFAELFGQQLGFDLTIIPWETEAALSLKGAAMVVGAETPIVLFDIGGGSTEFICRGADGKIHAAGTELGVVRLTETYIKHAPLAAEEYARLESYLQGELAQVARTLDPARPFTLVGTAGTVTSIAAMLYNIHPFDPAKVNNKVLLAKAVRELLRDVGNMPLEQRAKLPALENGREDLIIPGIGIVLCAMEAFGVDMLTVSDAGLREGLLLAAIEGTFPCQSL